MRPGPELVLVVRRSGGAASTRTSRPRTRCPGRRATGTGTADRSRQRPANRVARVADRLQRVARREMDDVHRHLRRFGQADDAVRRLALEHRIAGDAVVERDRSCLGHEVGGHDVDGQPVLRMHHDQAAVLRGLLHRPEDRTVVAVEHAGIGGEQLEVGNALRDQLVHLGQGRVVDVAHDHVEAVVDDGVALGLRMPRVQAGAQRLAPRDWTAKSTIDVVPPNAAARVPVSNVSLAKVPPNGSSMWVCTSIAPGMTYQPGGRDRLVGGPPAPARSRRCARSSRRRPGCPRRRSRRP